MPRVKELYIVRWTKVRGGTILGEEVTRTREFDTAWSAGALVVLFERIENDPYGYGDLPAEDLEAFKLDIETMTFRRVGDPVVTFRDPDGEPPASSEEIL